MFLMFRFVYMVEAALLHDIPGVLGQEVPVWQRGEDQRADADGGALNVVDGGDLGGGFLHESKHKD